MRGLQGRLVLVTGAGSGNGREISLRLASEGATVLATDIDDVGLAQTAELAAGAPGDVTTTVCDVADESSVAAMYRAADDIGDLGAVVAQAGVIFGKPLHESTVEDWDRQMAVDVRGTFLCLREAVARMMGTGGGSLVTMSGTYAWQAQPGVAGSVTAKSAIIGLTRAVAVEYGHHGIRCNTLMPGMVETPMIEAYFDRKGAGSDAERARLASLHAMNRLAQPEEVAAMAAFLCSDESSFSNGQVFAIDGGQTAGIGAALLGSLTGTALS